VEVAHGCRVNVHGLGEVDAGPALVLRLAHGDLGQRAAGCFRLALASRQPPHTCATLLLLAYQPAKVVSERLGHSSVTLTLDTYSHVLPTLRRRAADVMGIILGQKAHAKAG